MKNQLLDYGLQVDRIPIFCDNTSAIAITENPVQHSRTKHIDIKYHFIREHVMNGTVELHFVSSEKKLADIFTKPLDESTFSWLVSELGILNYSWIISDIFASYNAARNLIDFSILDGILAKSKFTSRRMLIIHRVWSSFGILFIHKNQLLFWIIS